MRLLLSLIVLTGVALSAPARAQHVPARDELRPGGPGDSGALLAEIESLLGDSETSLMGGLVDPGIDWGRLATEKILDEAVKAVANSAVLAPAAQKILSLYEQKKAQKLTSELGKLRQVMKDGQARLNKVRYQSFKIKAEAQKAHTETSDDLRGSRHERRTEAAQKALYGDGSAVLAQFDGPNVATLLREDFDAFRGGKSTLGYDVFLTAYAALGDTEAGTAKLAAARREGRVAYLSPYQRLTLLRTARREAEAQRQALHALRDHSYQALSYAKRRRAENRATDTYRIRTYTKYR